MAFQLRDYQIRVLNEANNALNRQQNVLFQGITGCGKTTIFSRLINRYYKETDRRFLILVHKQEVVQQIYNTLRDRTDIHFKDLGICCASLGQKTIDRRVTIASIQSIVGSWDNYGYADLIIIDEAHRCDINGQSQYKQAIDHLRMQRPSCRIFGCTSTPARLGHGYIYGHKCKPGSINLFPDISCKVTYKELKEKGYLAPLKGVVATHDSLERDLAGVSTNGDYVIDQLGDIMTREIHLDTAIEAIEEYCIGYKRICVFCCNISHAEKLRDMLGDRATTVHSQLGDLERQCNMQAWTSGQVPIMTSVNILVEGFDLPELDCLVMARPTLSSTLYLQAVGRVLRTHPGKDHGLLVDLTGNTAQFGTDLDNVKVTVPKAVEAAEKIERDMFKLCPNCEIEVHRALRECQECGFEWPENECVIAEALPDMQEVSFSAPVEPDIFQVAEWFVEVHESKSSGKELGKVTYMFWETEYKRMEVYLWLCLPDNYSGFAVQKAQEKWAQISDDNFPLTVDELGDKKYKAPTHIVVDMSGKYPDLVEVVCSDGVVCLNDDQRDDEIPFGADSVDTNVDLSDIPF